MSRHVLAAALITLALVTSVASGQYIEGYVRLDDPISGANGVNSVAYDSLANAIYVTGWRATLVFDAPTGRKIARMEQYGDWVMSAPEDGKMYVLGESVHVLDATTHALIRKIPVSCETYEVTPPAAYAPDLHRLYFETGRDSLAVIDTRNDSLRRAFPVEDGIWGLCCATDLNKLYVTNLRGVIVVDCANDSVTSTIRTSTDRYWSQAYSPVNHKLYRGGDDLVVIDCQTDSIIKRARSPQFFAFMVYNPVNNRVYCDYGYSAIVAIDCATDSIAAVIEAPTGFTCYTSCLNPASGRFYFDMGDQYAIIGIVDAIADTFVRTLAAGRHGFDPPYPNFGVDPVNNRIYFTNYEGGTVSVIDGNGDSLLPTLVTANQYGLDDLWYNPVTDRIIGLDKLIGGISIIDAASCSLAGTKCVAVEPVGVVFSNAQRKVYLADDADHSIVVVSSETDTAVKRIDGGLHTPMAVSLGGDKLYARSWSGNGFVRVIDCHTDSVVGSVNVSTSPSLLLSSGGLNKVFGMYDNTAFLIDGASDSVLRFIPLHHPVGTVGYSPSQECWYCIAPRGRDTITVIDGRSDTVGARLRAPGSYRSDRPLWNPLTDRLYYRISEDSSVVFDCRTNQVVGEVMMQYGRLCDTIRNRVYGFDRNGVVVLDGTTDSVLARFTISQPGKMAWDARRGRVYVGSGTNLVTVIRDTTTGLADAGLSVATRGSLATVVSNVLWVPMASGSPLRTAKGRRAVLLDAAGQRVTELQPGANDVRRIVPGVYFLQSVPAAVRKIVVAR